MYESSYFYAFKLVIMSSANAFSIKPIISSTRIIFGLLPGLGALILLRMVIHLYRPDIEDSEHRVKDYNFEELYDCYDFIIVGAGSAGSVLANRLSENSNWQILLLEAGPDENVLSEIPVLFPTLQTSSIDWQFVTEPSDRYCLSMIDTRCKWPRGKVLGGSSVLNAMLYIRGNKKDYDNWEAMGNPGWSYSDVLKYFLKAEDMRIPEYQSDPYHSTGGPISVEYFGYEHPITQKIMEAGQQFGYNILDVNGIIQTGFTRSHATIRDGLRCSTAKGYLRPAAGRPNLQVSMHSLVEKVLIDEMKRAYGVKFTKHGESRIVRARREVILSAGSLQTPQLLMLSGIGDSEHLKELGIHPIANLPGVGRNLQDHVAMGGHSFLFDNPYTNGTEYCFNLNTAMGVGNLIEFAVHNKGLLYSMVEAEAMAFVNTKYQDPAEDYPDIQLFIAPTADNLDGGLFGKRANGLSDETYAELYEDILYEPSFSIVPLLLRPKSRGYIKLRDANPFSPPLIYPNYYSEPDDILIMIEGARIVQQLVNQPALQELNARPNPNRNPGCAEHALMSDEHLECQARHHSLTIYHPVGTCAMGPIENLETVADARLKVHGINNLRVVDGSIMPTIVSGNTNAPIIMIGEKASDMIKEDWFLTNEYDIINCNVSPTLYEAKKSEDESPSKISLIPKYTLDVFNETAELYFNLPESNMNVNVNKIKGYEVSPSHKSNNKFIPYRNPYNSIYNPVYVDANRGCTGIPYNIPLPYRPPLFPYAGPNIPVQYPHLPPYVFIDQNTSPVYPSITYPYNSHPNTLHHIYNTNTFKTNNNHPTIEVSGNTIWKSLIQEDMHRKCKIPIKETGNIIRVPTKQAVANTIWEPTIQVVGNRMWQPIIQEIENRIWEPENYGSKESGDLRPKNCKHIWFDYNGARYEIYP